MNSFRADELLLTFDELKPFSDVLRDEMLLHRLHRMYKVSFILNSLAYHHLCMVALKDVMISAWIAMHLLEVAAAITCSNVTEDQISHLWHREDLAEYCVDTLIPSEGCIQRLHSGVYRNGVIECHTCWPTITVKQICNLFDRIQPVLHREEILRTIVWMIGHDSTFEEMLVFRYLASELLLKKEFGEAERKLVYANSIESKRLLIKVYEAWLVDGYLEEHERDQLSKRVQWENYCTRCSTYFLHGIFFLENLACDLGIVSPPSTTDKVLVDVCTNTPCRADLSTLLSTGDEDESFFSIKSDRTNVSDRSYASAITSPVGPDPRQRLLREKISGISLARELNGDKKMSSERQRGKPTAADKLSKSGNLSVTPTTQVVFSGRMEDRSLNGLASCQSSEYSAFSQTDKDEATSFWKGKSVGLPIFGRSQANITASDTNNVFGQQALKNVAPVSSVLGKAANMPCEHFSSPISGFAGQRNSDLGECSPLDALIPVISQTPQNIDSFSSTVNAEDQNEDENFYNNLVMELCQRRMGGSSKKLDPDSTDMEALQRKITQIEEQMRKTRSRLCGSTKMPTLDLSSMTTTPTSTPSEIRRENESNAKSAEIRIADVMTDHKK
ncbi:hypothetical protein Angca_001170 [Angiostrongylus cantonensis]|nr:hypothetical protein Angca_001170 [Angiostrongylus cantonensis]